MNKQLDYLPNYPSIHLYQDRDSFCINTDTGLLGNYIKINKGETVLDIGTNNGALLLYASLQNPSLLIGIDINKKAIELAKENMVLNKIENYILENIDAKEYLYKDKVDVVISNPPYFKSSPNEIANIDIYNAKHEDSLPLKDLVKCITNNLKDKGRLYMIYQSSRIEELKYELENNNVYIQELTYCYHHNKDISHACLVYAKKNESKVMIVKEPLIL